MADVQTCGDFSETRTGRREVAAEQAAAFQLLEPCLPALALEPIASIDTYSACRNLLKCDTSPPFGTFCKSIGVFC